jgi:hypothetical protein
VCNPLQSSARTSLADRKGTGTHLHRNLEKTVACGCHTAAGGDDGVRRRCGPVRMRWWSRRYWPGRRQRTGNVRDTCRSTAGNQRAYVVSRGAGAIVSVDLTGRRVLAQANVADARAIAVSNEVWVVTGSELVASEKEGLKETARIPIEGEPCSVAADGDRVFVIGTEPLLTEVDATTHRVSRVITDANSECGDIHVAFGSIWLSDNVGEVVHRVPLPMK